MKRLKSRIDSLEQHSSVDITQADRRMLISLLARRDALYWPWRFQMESFRHIPEIRRRQREYLDGSIGLSAKADGRSQWKDAHAMRQRLIASGYVTANHSGGQVQSVFLSPLGEAVARALVGDRLHTIETALPFFAYLKIMSEQPTGAVVRESVLFNRPCVGCPQDWEHMTDRVLPFLTAGMVDALSDTQGRTCYRPIHFNFPAQVNVDIAADDEADDLYLQAFDAERTILENCEPRDIHEIHIPLPASGWGSHFEQESNNETI